MSVDREMTLAEWCAKLPSQHVVNRELAELTKQLAALAEQNERQSKALNTLLDISQVSHVSANTLESVCRSALSLPNLATPVLNRIRAEGMEEAAEIVENTDVYTFVHGGSCYDDGVLTLSSAATTGYADHNYEEGTQ